MVNEGPENSIPRDEHATSNQLLNQSSVKSPPRSASLDPNTQGKKVQDRSNTSYTLFFYFFFLVSFHSPKDIREAQYIRSQKTKVTNLDLFVCSIKICPLGLSSF